MASTPTLPGPVIPLLINNTIDPQALNGGSLSTYAKYDNPVFGDILYQSWLGLSENNDPIDVTCIPIYVDPINELDLGFLMTITNDFVLKLDKGQVFYSYFLKRITDPPLAPKVESKRIHFGIGKAGRLSAPQIKESHDSQLDPDFITGPTFKVAVPPYTAMSNGDIVKLVWTGVNPDGTAGPAVPIPQKILSSTDSDLSNNPGQVLTWDLNKTNLNALREGSLRLHYEITYATRAEEPQTVSSERSIVLKPPVLAELAAPSVIDLVGTEINPGQFPDGIRVSIPLYPGIRVGDDVLVYGTRTGSGSGAAKNTVKQLKIDSSNIESGKIVVPIEKEWLITNRGASVNLRYQYARADAAGSGIPLELTVRKPLILPTPTVDNSVEIGNRDELDPMWAYSGAYISIPDTATIEDGDSVIAYFKGFGAHGSYEVFEPSQLNPMKFKVPATVLPYNFGKTVEVVYSVAGEMAKPSLNLFIREVDFYSQITCEGLQVGAPATLKLSDIPSGGSKLSIGLWPFISTPQIVRLWLTNSDIEDRDIIASRELLAEEVSGGVKAVLTREDLAGVPINGIFTLRFSVSFDGGNSITNFNNPLQIKLLA